MYKKIIWTIALILSVGCERKAPATAKIIIDLPKLNTTQKMENQFGNLSSGTAPLTWSDIDCFGFMIAGPDSSLRQNTCPLHDGSTGLKNGSFEFGPIFAGYSFNETAEFEVTSGIDREIIVIGFKSNMTGAAATTACKSILQIENDSFSKPFLVAKSEKLKIDPGSTQSVLIPLSYEATSAQFVGDCSGPTAPGHGQIINPPGPPVKAKVRFQDNLTSTNFNACIAVAVDLLDANGNLATVTEDYQFSISGTGANLFQVDGNYCNGTPLPTRTINFYDGPNRYNRVILFQQPNIVGAADFTLVQISPPSPSAPLAQELLAYDVVSYVNPSTNPPFSLSIFDVNSFRSTKSSTGSSPIDVKADECRPAIVQVLDSLGRPLKIQNNNSPSNFIYSTVSSISTPSNFVEFYSTSGCSGSSSTHNSGLDGGNSSPQGLNQFYYKVPAALAGSIFNLKALSTGTGYYDGVNPFIPLDPTQAINNKSVWRVKN
jgi:hypothetical protein